MKSFNKSLIIKVVLFTQPKRNHGGSLSRRKYFLRAAGWWRLSERECVFKVKTINHEVKKNLINVHSREKYISIETRTILTSSGFENYIDSSIRLWACWMKWREREREIRQSAFVNKQMKNIPVDDPVLKDICWWPYCMSVRSKSHSIEVLIIQLRHNSLISRSISISDFA